MADYSREGCDFTAGCTERMCRTLDKAGVPPDSKWRTLILYMRSMEGYDHLTDRQKSEIQGLILETLRLQDYSDERYREIMQRQEAILNEPCNQKLAVALQETAELVGEFKKLLLKRSGDVERLEDVTVDAIEKGGNPESVLTELKAAFREVVQVMESDAKNLNKMTITDALTGLFNRRGFDMTLDKAVQEWQAGKGPLTLIMLDIDHFKKFNDTYGHRIGDQALITVAKLMRQTAEELLGEGVTAHMARYGGEEFAVILPGSDADKGLEIAEVIRTKVEQYNFIIRGADGKVLKRGIKINISLGVAQAQESWGGSFTDNLVECADKALYDAKRGGRNLALKYNPETRTGDTC